MALPHQLIHRIEASSWLDKLAAPLMALVGRAVRSRPIVNVLSGSCLGHALDPVLTDLPIGASSMSGLLDTVG